MRRQSFVGEWIKLAGLHVALDRGIELPCVESLEPGAKSCQLLRGQLFDSFLDVFGCGHAQNITFVREARKSGWGGVSM